MIRFAHILFVTLLAGAANAGQSGDPAAPLGSPKYIPSPERPYGWRGDGSGRFPAANPPIAWERKKTGNTYATRGILWMTPLPSIGVSSPIIVGNRIYITTEVADIVCLEKQSGNILWIRSNPEFEGLSDEDRKSSPDFEKLAALLPELTKVNQDLVEQLNAQKATAATTAPKVPAAATKKKELEKQILTLQQGIDKKKFERYWGQAVFGFAGQTPTSDGKHVCAFFTTGVSACYDLDGNRKWIHRAGGGGSEHGNFASPLLCGNQLVVWSNEMRGYDVGTGKLLWTNPAKSNNTYGSLFRLQVGGDLVAAFQSGFFTRIRDGKAIWEPHAFGDAVATPVVENGLIYTNFGYPKNNDKKTGFRAFKVPTTTEGTTKLTQAFTFKTEWADDEIPEDQKKTPFDRGYVASPLYVDGLLYRTTQGGGLIVNDATTGDLIYRKVLPIKPRTQYWDWAGASTSPTLAGKRIFMMDNQGTTVIIEPGRQYKEVAKNMIEESKDGKDQSQNLATPVFEDTRMYYRTPYYLYCIGDR